MISIDDVAKVVGGKVINSTTARESSGSIFFDSRSPIKDGIFLALQGSDRDGHEFVKESGAAFALVSRQVDVAAIVVPDVLSAAARWATEHRSKLTDLTVIGITGSQGKTTTKDMIHHLLRLSTKGKEHGVVAPQGSYNNDLGVPFVITSCDDRTRYCVTEMGARHLGDILRLTEIAKPDIGIVLKVGTAHLGEFGSRERIAEAKSELVTGIRAGGFAILGTYDEFTPAMARDRKDLQVITFGERGDELVRATDVETRGGYAHFELVTPGGRETVELRIAGVHNIANALATAALGFALGIPENEIATALTTFEPASRWRMELQEIAGVTVINDAYNANPESMHAALETTRLIAQEKGGRTFAFLGTMNELGEASDSLHREIAEAAVAMGIDYLISVGEPRYLIDEQDGSEIALVAGVDQADSYLQSIEPGDCVLFKASRSIGLEVLAGEFITLLKSRDNSLSTIENEGAESEGAEKENGL